MEKSKDFLKMLFFLKEMYYNGVEVFLELNMSILYQKGGIENGRKEEKSKN